MKTKIEIGDLVRHMKVGQTWKVIAISGNLFTLKSDFGHKNMCFGENLQLVEHAERTKAEKEAERKAFSDPYKEYKNKEK